MQHRHNRRIGKAAADAVEEAERLLAGRLLDPVVNLALTPATLTLTP
jgi:hypothetical protein